MKNTALNSAPNISSVAALPAANAGERNRRIGSIGRRARTSQTTNAIDETTPPASVATTSRLLHPALLPRTRPHTIPSAAAVTSTSPGPSSPARGPKLSSMRPRTSGIAASPIGTLSQKIHCQARVSVIAPPNTGPATTARPVIAPNSPSAHARRSGGKAALSSASDSGAITAAPAPWTARAVISQPMFVASAHAADAATNSSRPAANSRRRPNRSPSAAPVISSTAKLRP